MKSTKCFRTFGFAGTLIWIVACLLALPVSPLHAEEPDPWGIEARSAYATLQENRDQILFIDVRDPIEIQFTGFTDEVDINIPFLEADRTRWNADRATFLMDRNPRFVAAVRRALEAKGLDREAKIFTLCRSGSERGNPSAAHLRANGFPNAHYIVHGFQGDALQEGPQRGMRLKNGWQNSGLPWSPRMNAQKIHRPDREPAQEWLVILSSASTETQAMALILARAEAAQGTFVRILLCDQAGMLAVSDSDSGSAAVQPIDRSPRQLLAALIEDGAVVELCGIFSHTRGIEPSRFIEGVSIASPPGIARQISQPNVRVLTY